MSRRRRAKSRSHAREPEPASRSGIHRVSGNRAVVELLRAAPQRVRRVLLQQGKAVAEIEQLAAAHGVPIQRWDRAQFQDAGITSMARGVAAEAEPPALWDLDALLTWTSKQPSPRIVVALDGVQDPQNLGAVMRSCAFFGIAGLLWPKDRSASLGEAVVRASAGASERLPLAQVTNLARALEHAKKQGFWVAGLVVDGGVSLARWVADGQVPEPLVLVFGAEDRGLRRLTRDRCDWLVTIDRHGALGSLNVSAAAAVTVATLVMGTADVGS